MSFNKVKGVLMELNSHELLGLSHILETAEDYLVDVRRDELWETIAMIDGLREVFDIPTYGEGQPTGRLEAIAARVCFKNLECATPSCPTLIRAVSGLEAWREARQQGWKLTSPTRRDVILLCCPSCSKERGLTR